MPPERLLALDADGQEVRIVLPDVEHLLDLLAGIVCGQKPVAGDFPRGDDDEHPRERAVDVEDRDGCDFERPLETYTLEQQRTIRNGLKAVKARESAARRKGDAAKADDLKRQYDEALALYNKATRPGGRSTLSADQMNNVKRRIRDGIKTVLGKLSAKGGVFRELADSWKVGIKVGNECYYAPEGRVAWEVQMF